MHDLAIDHHARGGHDAVPQDGRHVVDLLEIDCHATGLGDFLDEFQRRLAVGAAAAEHLDVFHGFSCSAARLAGGRRRAACAASCYRDGGELAASLWPELGSVGLVEAGVEFLCGFVADVAGDLDHRVDLFAGYPIALQPVDLAQALIGMVGRDMGRQRDQGDDGRMQVGAHETSFKALGFSGLTASMVAEAMKSSTPRPGAQLRMNSRLASLGAMRMSAKPASASMAVSSSTLAAPATQAVWRATSFCMASGSGAVVTISEMARRPPGFSTRQASRKTCALSGDRLMTQLEMMASTVASASCRCSISSRRNDTFA